MTVLLDINHETADLTQYDSTVTDSGDLSVTAAARLGGSNYGLSCVIDDTNAIYGIANLSPPASGILRVRFYLDPNSLTMANGDAFRVLRLWDTAGGGAIIFAVNLTYYTATGYRFLGTAYDDANNTYTISTTDIGDEPHYLEFYLTSAATTSSNDGICTVWIDGSQVGARTDLDNNTRFAALDQCHIGAVSNIDAGTSGTLYLDELVVNDDGGQIGPAGRHTPPAHYNELAVF